MKYRWNQVDCAWLWDEYGTPLPGSVIYVRNVTDEFFWRRKRRQFGLDAFPLLPGVRRAVQIKSAGGRSCIPTSVRFVSSSSFSHTKFLVFLRCPPACSSCCLPVVYQKRRARVLFRNPATNPSRRKLNYKCSRQTLFLPHLCATLPTHPRI